ncbi:hypothetical protein Bca52824_008972 [Brassica carinata]|uniref:Pentatricopeptide repeat-containing protein n=1 Tax=Brassica carinata TaxID=52824 RepID=A0A8X8B6I0_BRACI|nr:hypothetical protein Bca52824_008972 [Brassica carinata]
MLVFAHSHHPWSSISPTVHLLGTCKTPDDVEKIHARLITTGFIKNPDLTTRIVLAFASSPRPFLAEFARCIFHEHHVSSSGEVKDPFLWNAVIKSHSHGVDPMKALFLFCLMLENGVPVDRFSMSLALKACSRLGFVKEGMQIHGFLIKSGTWSDLFLQNCLIGLYIKCGCLGFARQVFDKMPLRDSVSYNSMIDGGYAQTADGVDVAAKLFDEMPEKDLISWNSMIGGYVKHGRIEDAKVLFDVMPRRDVVTWAIMIDGYHMEALEVFNHMEKESHLSPDETTLVIVLSAIAQLGSVQHATRVFEGIGSKSIDHWNAMIGGLAVHGLGESAFDLLLQIERRSSVKPDHITFVGVLNACSHSGSIELAKNLIEGMPIEPNDVIWRTFLTACSQHKEFETGSL